MTPSEMDPDCRTRMPLGAPASGEGELVGATVVDAGPEGVVVLLDDGTRRVVELPAARGLLASRRGQRVGLRVACGRIIAAGLVSSALTVHHPDGEEPATGPR